MTNKELFAQDDFRQQYALALKTGEKWFGSPCQHVETKNGVCTNCLRRVVTGNALFYYDLESGQILNHDLPAPQVPSQDTSDEYTKHDHTCGLCGKVYYWSASDIAWGYEQETFMPCWHKWEFLDKTIETGETS